MESPYLGVDTKNQMDHLFYSTRVSCIQTSEYKRIIPCKRVDQKMDYHKFTTKYSLREQHTSPVHMPLGEKWEH